MLLVGAARARMVGASRHGPADEPEKHSDWGGTPDARVSAELGLSVEELEALLERIASADVKERVEAALDLERDAAGSEQAIREVLWKPHGARNTQIKAALREARSRFERGGDEEREGGLLAVLLTMDPTDPDEGDGIRAATRILAMLVALHGLDSMAGYKVMLDFSARHAGAFRHEIGRMLVAAGLKALPALVYGRGSSDDELHMFSVKWIRDLGNPKLGEQVRGIENPRRLAQLLEAYASVNELDAIDVTLSFTDHGSVFVRNAARACLEEYGVNAKWKIREKYENTFSREAEEGTTYEDWREELYRFYDERRIEPAMERFERGLAAAESGDWDEMHRLYREVLREFPMFQRRFEMAAGLLQRADRLEEQGRRDEARESTLLALRVAEPGGPEAGRAEARLLWLEAEATRFGGVLDEGLYRRALRIAPGFARAKRWIGDDRGDGLGELAVKGVIVSFFVFLAALLVWRRVRAVD